MRYTKGALFLKKRCILEKKIFQANFPKLSIKVSSRSQTLFTPGPNPFHFPISRVSSYEKRLLRIFVGAPYTNWWSTNRWSYLSGRRSHMKSYKKRRFSESISDSDKSQNVKITSELFYDIAELINIHFLGFPISHPMIKSSKNIQMSGFTLRGVQGQREVKFG